MTNRADKALNDDDFEFNSESHYYHANLGKFQLSRCIFQINKYIKKVINLYSLIISSILIIFKYIKIDILNNFFFLLKSNSFSFRFSQIR